MFNVKAETDSDASEQTVQTLIRLLLKEQSDQGLHCLLFCCHQYLIHHKIIKPVWLKFLDNYINFIKGPKILNTYGNISS